MDACVVSSLVIVGVLIGLAVYIPIARRKSLLSKYGDSALVDRLMRHQVWVGQTAEQLRDSLGSPINIDQKVLKTKVKETWKYRQTGKNRFGLRIFLDDGEVSGWDDKR